MIKAVIFDCFGVLFPNASGMFYVRHKALFGDKPGYLDELNSQIDLDEITSTEFFEKLGAAIGMTASQIQAEFEHELVLNVALVDFIKGIKAQYKIALLSNAGSEEIAVIDRAGIRDLFDARAVSSEVGTVKPKPEIFLICAERLDVRPDECIFIDDTEHNLPPARAMGMKTILYTDFDSFERRFTELTRD